MKAPTLLFLWLVFLVAASVPGFSFDIGGVLDNISDSSVAEEFSWVQKDKLSLWLDLELGQHLGLYFKSSYTLRSKEPNHLVDLEALHLDGSFPAEDAGPSILQLSLGRFPASDFTGQILDHNIDGLLLGFRYPRVTVSAAFGYTGLLLKDTSTIIISRLDALDSADDDILLASSRLVGLVDATFPELLGRQSLALSFLFQEDLRSGDKVVEEDDPGPDLDKGGKLDTQYLGFGIFGPLTHSLDYHTLFYWGSGRTLSLIDDAYTYKPIASFLAGAGVRYYLPEALQSRIAFRFLFASGDADHLAFIEGNSQGNSGTFVPISKPQLALVFTPQLGNLFLFDLSYSIKPLSWTGRPVLDKLQTLLKVISFFRATDGPISEAGIRTGSGSSYLGTEIDAVINFRPFSDLGTALSLGYFLPNTGGAFDEEYRQAEFLARIEFSLNF